MTPIEVKRAVRTGLEEVIPENINFPVLIYPDIIGKENDYIRAIITYTTEDIDTPEFHQNAQRIELTVQCISSLPNTDRALQLAETIRIGLRASLVEQGLQLDLGRFDTEVSEEVDELPDDTYTIGIVYDGWFQLNGR